MNLISAIRVKNFRSLQQLEIEGCGDFTALAGLNNSGKSNVLRAMSAFFTGSTDPGVPLDIDRDYCRQLLPRRQARRIAVEVKFKLPAHFNFRKGLESTRTLLGTGEFWVTKEWSRSSSQSVYLLNGTRLSADDHQKVDQFLALISFRFIPNRVLPLDIIRGEQPALRDALVRRLSMPQKEQQVVFDTLRATSTSLIDSLNANVTAAAPEIGTISLATPRTWRDLVFAFAYLLTSGENIAIEDSLQGSGIQSLLMLETLALIDRDFQRRFGWRQAVVWAIEEPESSLHSNLEAHVAALLGQLATSPQNRLQIFSTTHSDLVLQFADRPVLLASKSGLSTVAAAADRRAVLDQAAREGISRWVHPLLADPLTPIVLVEGKFDEVFISAALQQIAPGESVAVRHLSVLEEGEDKGGVDALFKYLRANRGVVRARLREAPVIVLIDWDSLGKRRAFADLFDPDDPFAIMVWPDGDANPRLSRSFTGIERFMSDRVIDQADAVAGVMGRKADGKMTVAPKDYGRLKTQVASVVRSGLGTDDLTFAMNFLREVMTTLRDIRAK
jgi:hypothetical protein